MELTDFKYNSTKCEDCGKRIDNHALHRDSRNMIVCDDCFTYRCDYCGSDFTQFNIEDNICIFCRKAIKENKNFISDE